MDTSSLNVSAGGVHAIKFGWSSGLTQISADPATGRVNVLSTGSGTCCIDLLESTGLAPCIPGSCGVMTRDSLLPLNPFFATIWDPGCKVARNRFLNRNTRRRSFVTEIRVPCSLKAVPVCIYDPRPRLTQKASATAQSLKCATHKHTGETRRLR